MNIGGFRRYDPGSQQQQHRDGATVRSTQQHGLDLSVNGIPEVNRANMGKEAVLSSLPMLKTMVPEASLRGEDNYQ